jgi:hypothetical protein
MENFGGMGVEVPLQHSQNTSADTAHWEALIIPHLATDVAGDRVFTFTFAGNEERTWAVEDLEGNKLDFEAGQNYQYHFTVKEKTITTTTSDSMSNCYMVKPNTTLKFPVTRAYADSTNLRTGDAFADGTFKVKVIWADVSGLLTSPTTTLSNVSGTGPTAEVSVTAAAGKTGNAVIGIYKSTDTDTPVWSYHIWVTDPDDIITYTNQYTYSDTEYKFRFMDRNLGATAAGLGSGKGTGLFYQWGRKDPFPATGAPGDNQAEGKFTATDVSATTGTIVYTIKYPNIFIYQGGTSNSGDWHWGMRDNTLWGHNDVKSIYDPCPTGWRVPVNINMSSDTSPWFSYTSANGGTWANGYTWDGNNFPACGRRWGDRDAGILGTVGSFGRYWTASPYSLKSTTAANMGITYGTCNVYATGGDRAMGFSVRCVLEY